MTRNARRDHRMLSALRTWHSRLALVDVADETPLRITFEELDVLIRTADDLDALKRRFVELPDDDMRGTG